MVAYNKATSAIAIAIVLTTPQTGRGRNLGALPVFVAPATVAVFVRERSFLLGWESGVAVAMPFLTDPMAEAVITTGKYVTSAGPSVYVFSSS